MQDGRVWSLARLRLAEAAMVDGRILEFERPYGPPEVVAEVRPPQVTFSRLIGSVDGNRVLVDTSSGGGRARVRAADASNGTAASGGFPSRIELPAGGTVALRSDRVMGSLPEVPHR